MSTSHLWSNSEGKFFSPPVGGGCPLLQALNVCCTSIYSTAHFPRQSIITSLDPLILGSKATQEVAGAGAGAATAVAVSLIVAVLL